MRTAHPDSSGHRLLCIGGSEPLEQRALEELRRYVSAMTGAQLPLAGDDAPADACVVSVGRTPLSDSLVQRRIVTAPENPEAFVIVSVARQGAPEVLCLLGGSPVGTLYAVYHYLESACGVGFFWDGDQVPRLRTLPIHGLDVSRSPRFPVREYMMDCEYTSWWWGWEEWKAEVDWASRHRYNLLSSNFDFTATWRAVWERFGVHVPPSSLSGPPYHPWGGWHKWSIYPPYPEEFQDANAELCKRFVDYGRSLGMQMAPDYRGFLGQVPEEFYAAYRGRARFIEVDWLGFQPPGKFIHPSDPLYVEVHSAYLREHIARFGTDHRYAAPTFSEMAPGDTPAEQAAIKRESGRAAIRSIQSVDPRGVAFSLSWTWLNSGLWPPEEVKAYLDLFPPGTLEVWELWDDEKASFGGLPTYRRFDYFSGRPWLLGFLHSYGGTTYPHGDLGGLIARVQETAVDPKAHACQGVAFQPEALRHDAIWFDLLSRLSWNPEGITLESFLEDYARRRYGADAAPRMVPALTELAASVYGTDDMWTPRYQRRLLEHLTHREKALSAIGRAEDQALSVPERARFLPRLQRALQIMLAQAETLGGSSLFGNDLTDVARSYVGTLFDSTLLELYTSFLAHRAPDVRRAAQEMDALMASQEQLLAANPFFHLAPLIERALRLPGAPPSMARAIRDILTVWAGRILDYARRDYYELVRFYYRKRVDAFLSHVLDRAADGTWRIDDAELISRYERIENDFVQRGFVVDASDLAAASPVDAARRILARHAAP